LFLIHDGTASCARDAGIAKTATRKKAKMKNRLNFIFHKIMKKLIDVFYDIL